jgi:hypothetical protein
MDNLIDILKNKNYQEPDYIVKIKKFIMQKFEEECSVKLSNSSITIKVKNSSLAGALRENIVDIQNLLPSNFTVQIVTGNF